MRRSRIAVNLNPGAADALEWLTDQSGETPTSAINAALRALANMRGMGAGDRIGDLEDRVAALEAWRKTAEGTSDDSN